MERYMMILKSLKRMNPELEQALRENVHPMNLSKDEILQSPEALNDTLYFVEKGILHYFDFRHGHKTTMAFRWEDQFVLTLKSVFGTKPGPYNGIEALEDSTLWYIPGGLVDELLQKYIEFNFHLRVILERDTISIIDTYHCAHPTHGPENLKNLTSNFPQLLHRVPVKYLANLTQIPEKQLKHLLKSPIKLITDGKRRRRGGPKGTI